MVHSPENIFVKKESCGNFRSYGIYICSECGDRFESRLDYSKKMTGCCRRCANINGGRKRATHGFNNKNSRLHVVWANMKRRCLNPRNKEKKIYKGITICEEWLEYMPFKEWAEQNGYDDNKTIDRIDTKKGYSPSNCRFVNHSVQSANRRITDKNKSGYIGVSVHNGKWRAQVQWHGKRIHLGSYYSKKEAARIRDEYILNNDLPHTLNFKYQDKARELKKQREEA